MSSVLGDSQVTLIQRRRHLIAVIQLAVSYTICYKCKRELEKYEKYIQVLEVELKQFRELYRQPVEQFEIRFDFRLGQHVGQICVVP